MSNAATRMSEGDLESMFADSQSFNAAAAVTGILLHDEGNYFHYVEGTTTGLRKIRAHGQENSRAYRDRKLGQRSTGDAPVP